MKTIKRFYNKIYTVPSLLMHELSHVFTAYLVGGKLTKVDIKNYEDRGCSVRLKFINLKNMSCVRFVAMSPILVPLLFIFLSFINTDFIYALFYSITTYKTTLPSQTDFRTSNIESPKFL